MCKGALQLGPPAATCSPEPLACRVWVDATRLQLVSSAAHLDWLLLLVSPGARSDPTMTGPLIPSRWTHTRECQLVFWCFLFAFSLFVLGVPRVGREECKGGQSVLSRSPRRRAGIRITLATH